MKNNLNKSLEDSRENLVDGIQKQHGPIDMPLEGGQKLKNAIITYSTWGKLNKGRSNAILICHALSGDQYAAGINPVTKKEGWWQNMIGANRILDTNKYFIICPNVLGGCMGTTGPSSININSEEPYGLSFPIYTIKDMVNMQVKLIDHLKIEQLFCILGGSMGGMQVLEWASSHSIRVYTAIPIAASYRHTAQNIAFHEVGRQAIMNDLYWN